MTWRLEQFNLTDCNKRSLEKFFFTILLFFTKYVMFLQGSASESEDENRRSLLNSNPPSVTPRQRHDSYTMGVTQISQPPR